MTAAMTITRSAMKMPMMVRLFSAMGPSGYQDTRMHNTRYRNYIHNFRLLGRSSLPRPPQLRQYAVWQQKAATRKSEHGVTITGLQDK